MTVMVIMFFFIVQGYEGSLLKVTNKNGKNLSPVGFVTFASRIDAETAKQELTVRTKKTFRFSMISI